MKVLLSVFLFLLLFTPDTLSQNLNRMQSWGLDLESVAWANDQEGICVGENLIIRTADGGSAWEEVVQKFGERFFDVVYLDSGKAVAVGQNGIIYLSKDGGISWQQKISGSQNDLFSIAKSSSSALIAVGKNGEILSSKDSGESWAKVLSATSLNLNDITFASENIGYVAADSGKILKSIDGGVSWSISSLAQNSPLYGIAFSNEMIGYAVGESGLFVKTLDAGANWTVLKSPTTRTLRKVAISQLDVRIAVAVGDSATVVRTANSGTTFSRPNLGTTNTRHLKGISFKPSSNLASAVGQDGYLTNSANGGASWVQKLAGIRNNFTSVDFKNLNSGFIAGEKGALFVTSNGAETLTPRPIPDSISIQTIDFWNTSFGYTGSENGKIYRTTNSGRTWVPVFTPADRSISGFYLFATSVLYLAGSQGYISSSFESGNAWSEPKVSNTTENLKDLMFFDYQYGFAIGEKGQISWSNGGTVWQTQPKLTEENLNGLAKIDTTRAFVVGNGGVILKTDDKAKTWTVVASGTTKNLNSIDFFGESNGYIAGEEGLVLVTSDGGVTWKQFPSGTTRSLRSVSAASDQKAYFTGEDGTIIAYTCVAPTGNLGEITGDSESCLISTNYSIQGLPENNSEIVWRVDGGEILSGQGTSQIEVKWSKSGRNAVLVSRSNFCGTGETSALEVNIVSLPPSNVTLSGDGAVCQGIPYIYSLPNVAGVTYTWNVSGGQVTQGQGTHSIEIIWDEDGEQQVSAIQENRCGSTEPIFKSVVVNSEPESPLGISGEPKVGLGEQIYEIDTVAGLNYRWNISDNGGKVISGQGAGRIVVFWEKEGDYELAVEAQNECGFSTKRILPVNVNIITALEPIKDESFKIYPNPSQENLTISSESLDSWSSMAVFSSDGKLILTQTILSGQNEIQLSLLPKGLLLIRLQGKNGVLSRKILVL